MYCNWYYMILFSHIDDSLWYVTLWDYSFTSHIFCLLRTLSKSSNKMSLASYLALIVVLILFSTLLPPHPSKKNSYPHSAHYYCQSLNDLFLNCFFEMSWQCPHCLTSWWGFMPEYLTEVCSFFHCNFILQSAPCWGSSNLRSTNCRLTLMKESYAKFVHKNLLLLKLFSTSVSNVEALVRSWTAGHMEFRYELKEMLTRKACYNTS